MRIARGVTWLKDNLSELPVSGRNLRHAVAICQILFGYTFDKIDQKTGTKANNTGKLMKRAIERVECNDFHKVLININTINRLRQFIKIVNNSKLLAENIRKAMLVYNNLQPHIIILD